MELEVVSHYLLPQTSVKHSFGNALVQLQWEVPKLMNMRVQLLTSSTQLSNKIIRYLLYKMLSKDLDSQISITSYQLF